jgi:hypothetical protein
VVVSSCTDVPSSGLLDAGRALDPDLGHCVLLFGYVPAWADCTPALQEGSWQPRAGHGRAAAGSARLPAAEQLVPGVGCGGRALAPVGWCSGGSMRAGSSDCRRGGRAHGQDSAAAEEEPAEEMRAGDETLHVAAVEVRDGDRILDPPDELRQESVTVRGTPRQVTGWRGRRVVIDSTAGVFQLGATDPVTVRRAT